MLAKASCWLSVFGGPRLILHRRYWKSGFWLELPLRTGSGSPWGSCFIAKAHNLWASRLSFKHSFSLVSNFWSGGSSELRSLFAHHKSPTLCRWFLEISLVRQRRRRRRCRRQVSLVFVQTRPVSFKTSSLRHLIDSFVCLLVFLSPSFITK